MSLPEYTLLAIGSLFVIIDPIATVPAFLAMTHNDAPPQRINAKDTPIPYHPNLWSTHRPSGKMIAAKARQLLRE